VTVSESLRDDLPQLLGLLVALLVFAGTIVLFPSDIASHDVRLVLAVFFATVTLWVTKPVPYAVSSLLSVILLYVLGLVPTFEAAVSGYASNLVFFMILLLIIGKSIDRVGLDEWIANFLVSPSTTPDGSVRRLSTTMLLLTFIMPSGTARTVAFMPIIDQTNEVYRLDDDSQFRRLAYYVVGHLNPVGSLALMTGGGVSITVAGMIDSMVRPITWVEWFVYMAPPVVSLFVVAVVTVSLLYNVDDDLHAAEGVRADGSTDSIGADIAALTRQQKLIVGTLVVAILFWVLGSFVGVPTIVPAMFVVFVFSLPHVRVITADEVRDISWGIVFLLGTMLSLLNVMQTVDAFDLIIATLTSVLPMQAYQPVVLLVLFVAAVLVRGVFSSIAASYIILFPILLEFVRLIDANPLYFALGLAIILMCTTFLPFNIPTVLIAYESGPLRLRDVLLLGLVTMLLGFSIVALSWAVYWPLLDGAAVLSPG